MSVRRFEEIDRNLRLTAAAVVAELRVETGLPVMLRPESRAKGDRVAFTTWCLSLKGIGSSVTPDTDLAAAAHSLAGARIALGI